MRIGLAWILLMILAGPAYALSTAEDIRDCVRKNFPASSSTQTFQLKTIGRDGSARSLHAIAYWRRGSDGRAKVMLTVDKPDDLRGSSYLMLEQATRDDLFMYLPAVNRVKRILGNLTSDPLWGTDFSYEDIKQVQGIFDSGRLAREDDAELNGRKVLVLSVIPDAAEESAYARIRSYVDPDTCVALQTEFFRSGDSPQKRLIVDPKQVRQVGTRWMAHFYEMRNLRDDTRTELHIEKVTVDTNLPDRLFNPNTFYLGR